MTCQSASRMQNIPDYSAPEILNSEETSKASDVYSFAIIVFELLTKKTPFDHLQTTNKIFHEVVLKGGRPMFPTGEDEIPQCYREVIEACWSQDPHQRPSFDDIVYKLRNDSRFFDEEINKEKFFNYVYSIEKFNESKNLQKVDENENESVNKKIDEKESDLHKIEEFFEEQNSDEISHTIQLNSEHQNHESHPSVEPKNQQATTNLQLSHTSQRVSEEEENPPNQNQESPQLSQLSCKLEIQKKFAQTQPQLSHASQRVFEEEVNPPNQQQELVTRLPASPQEESARDSPQPAPSRNQLQEPISSQLPSQNHSFKPKLEKPASQPPQCRQAPVNLGTNSSSFSSDLASVYAEIRDDSSSLNWVIARFDASTKSWEFGGKGNGGFDEMISSIPNEFAGYCYFRMNSCNRGINLPVFVIVKFVTSGVKMITKAHMNAKRGEIESIFNYSNKSLEVSNLDEFKEEISKIKNK